MCGPDDHDAVETRTPAQQRASIKAQLKSIASHVASTVKVGARETKALEKQLAALSK